MSGNIIDYNSSIIDKNNLNVVNNKAFNFNIIRGKMTITMTTRKIRVFYKQFKYFFKLYYRQNIDTLNLRKVKIKFNEDILKYRDRFVLAFSIVKVQLAQDLLIDKGVAVTISIKEKELKYIWSRDYVYLINKANILKDIACFMSDYLTPNSGNRTNEIFYSTIIKLVSSKTNYTNIRIPNFDLGEFDLKQFNHSIDELHSKYFSLDCLSLNLTYILKSGLRNCCNNEESNRVMQNILLIIYDLNTKFKTTALIFNVTLANIDECFPLSYIFDRISNYIAIKFNRKFIINFRSFCIINHPVEINGKLNVFAKGKSVSINKLFCKVEDFNKIYSLFAILTKRHKKLHKKYIQLLLAKFLVDYKFYNLDKFSNLNDNILKLEERNSCVNNIESLSNSKLKRIFENCDSNDETKMILFSDNFHPLEF